MEKPHLHDATLFSILINWGKKATAEVRFRMGGSQFILLKVSNVTALHCPHENPWGPSVSVNEVRGPIEECDEAARLEIEVQSGDTIIIKGSAFEWEY